MGIIIPPTMNLRAAGRETEQRYRDLADALMKVGIPLQSKLLKDAAMEVEDLRKLVYND